MTSYVLGLVGEGISASLTPAMQEREGRERGLQVSYRIIDAAREGFGVDDLPELLSWAQRLGFDGLNITHPFKQAMVPLVDEVSPAVVAIGALNTVLIRDGRTEGHNTDVSGFRRAFVDGLPDVDRDRVVLIGAGGAGTAVAHALAGLGVRRLLVVDPDRGRAAALAATLDGQSTAVELVSAGGLAAAVEASAGLVNASPMGMASHPGSPVPDGLLRPDLWLADIVYRPLDTALLAASRRAGCTVLSGAGMAVHQAADAFELITGLSADRRAMLHDFDDLASAETTQPRARDTTQGRKD